MKRLRLLTTVAAVAMCVVACGGSPSGSTGAASASPAAANRPSSPVKITLVSPTNGEVVHGRAVHVVVSISGGTISQVTSANVTPTVGHVHLYLNNQLVYMAYTLQQDLPVHPGLEYTMYAEFVAQDHFPFNPRDVTKTIFFTVAPS
jgi:hypothetical protein